jgi:hypothetical protein
VPRGVQLCAALLCRECCAWREPTEHASDAAAADDAAGAVLKTEWVAEYLVLYELSLEHDADVAAAGRLPSGEAALRAVLGASCGDSGGSSGGGGGGWGAEQPLVDALRAEAEAAEAGWMASGWLCGPGGSGMMAGTGAAPPQTPTRHRSGPASSERAEGDEAAAARRTEEAAAAAQATEWALLLQIEAAADHEFRQHQQELWAEVHPPTGQALAAAAERATTLQAQLSSVYAQIRQEQAQQRRLLEQLEAGSSQATAGGAPIPAGGTGGADALGAALHAAQRAAQRAAAEARRRPNTERPRAAGPLAAAAPLVDGDDLSQERRGRPQWAT